MSIMKPGFFNTELVSCSCRDLGCLAGSRKAMVWQKSRTLSRRTLMMLVCKLKCLLRVVKRHELLSSADLERLFMTLDMKGAKYGACRIERSSRDMVLIKDEIIDGPSMM